MTNKTIFCCSNVYDLNFFACEHLNRWSNRCEKYDQPLDILFGQQKRLKLCEGVEINDKATDI